MVIKKRRMARKLKKKIVFVTGTRADYGKLKSIILNLQNNKSLKTKIFVTGMHNMQNYGKTIGEIKKDKIKNPEKLKFINDEYLILNNQLKENMNLNDKLNSLYDELKAINSKLWDIEDDKRNCEKNSDVGENFIKLSRDVHFLNDDRAKIKLEINNITGSKIKEIKEYTSY